MLQLFADGHPAVGVLRKRQFAHLVPYVAVGLVDVMLFEFFHHYFPLHFERFLGEGEGEHAVAFQPEGCFQVFRGKFYVVVGKVVGGVGVVLSASHLQGLVVFGDINASAEHEVLEEVSKAGLLRVFIPCANIVEDVYHRHGGSGVFVHDHAQSVIQRKL